VSGVPDDSYDRALRYSRADHRAFTEAINAAPHDATPRAVYADYLDDLPEHHYSPHDVHLLRHHDGPLRVTYHGDQSPPHDRIDPYRVYPRETLPAFDVLASRADGTDDGQAHVLTRLHHDSLYPHAPHFDQMVPEGLSDKDARDELFKPRPMKAYLSHLANGVRDYIGDTGHEHGIESLRPSQFFDGDDDYHNNWIEVYPDRSVRHMDGSLHVYRTPEELSDRFADHVLRGLGGYDDLHPAERHFLRWLHRGRPNWADPTRPA
jgi:uncharacterized protein (TIGR02996 family)